MNSLFTGITRITRLMPAAPLAGVTAAHGVAQHLMERAEAGAGRSPQQAQELRRAACAYLSVVR